MKCQSLRGIAQEGLEAYKDIEEVMNAAGNADTSKKAAGLLLIGVIKGSKHDANPRILCK